MENNDITVGIPFYFKTSPGEFILAVDSILNQTLQPSKIHFIQDGAIDSKLEKIVDSYLSNHSHIISIQLEKSNLAKALNESIKRSNTKYYARMDSDDISMLDRFKIQYEFLEKNPHISIVGSWAIEFEDNINNSNNFIKKVPDQYAEIVRFYHYRNPLIHPTVIFRRSVFDIVGYYNERFSTDQDLDLWGRCIKYKIGISNIQTPLLYHNIKGIHSRRTKFKSIYNQISARCSLSADTFELKLLKFAAICFRFMPKSIIKYGYKKLR